MAPITNHVTISITTDSVGVTKPGFGIPLIASHNASFAERVRTYTDLAGLTADGFVATSPEFLAATALFAQDPSIVSLKIGRFALKPTQTYTIIPVAADSTAYTITARGEGVTTEDVTFTSDATGTVAEITAGLTTALNAVVGKNFTAVDGTTEVTVDGDAAGDWFSLEVADVSLLGIVQDHVDPGIATDIAAVRAEDDDWYGLITLYNSEPMVIAAAVIMNALDKIYIAASNESEAITTAVGNGDLIDTIKTNNYTRIAGFYHPSPANFADAAWYGKILPTVPGKATAKFKTMTGVTAVVMTSTQRANLIARDGNSYETVAGVSITFEGTMGDGTFIDSRRGQDWLTVEISTAVFALLAGAPKISYTDDGVSRVKAKIRKALEAGIRNEYLAANPVPTVTAPLVADIDAADKTARTLPDVKFTATEAGAIHDVTITGVLSV